jgi:hypothetical protein
MVLETEVTDRMMASYSVMRRNPATTSQAGPVPVISTKIQLPDGTTEYLKIVVVDLDNPLEREAWAIPGLGVRYLQWFPEGRFTLFYNGRTEKWVILVG